MTRAALYRHILALAMLPNWTAYWWLLPRRAKRFRTMMDVMVHETAERAVRKLCEEYHHTMAFMNAIRGNSIAPISEQAFRLPVSLPMSFRKP